MFARFFKSSSNDCLQSDDPVTPSQQLREENRRSQNMVTTHCRARELAETPSVNGDPIIIDEVTPVPKKRGRPRKSLPAEDDEVVVTPRSTNSSRKLPVQESHGEITPKQQSPQVIEEMPASVKGVEEPQTIEAVEEAIQKLTANGYVITSSKTTTTATTPVANKHKRFDSAEPEPVPEQKPEVIIIEDDEDASSDDEAPEEVTKTQATQSAKIKEREAAKAIEEQEAASKKKRQEKDAILKRQSEASSKKRKLDAAPEQDGMLPPARKAKVEKISVPETTQREDIEMDEESNTLEGEETADGRSDFEDDIEEIDRRFAPPGHLPLPALLPAEYLEDDDDAPEPTHLHSTLPTRFANANKLRCLLEKRPKDKRVGSTTFRVGESQNPHLPPKASKQARALKESWLQGRAGTKIKPNRKPFNQRFTKSKN